MLFVTPRLTKGDRRVLEEVEEMRSDLRFRLAEPRRWEGQFRRSLVAEAIRGSNTIEGYTIGSEDAEALVAGVEMPGEPDDATREAVTGYRDALTYVQQAAHFEIFTYDHMLLSALHFMMVRHDLQRWPGRYRDGAIWVTGGRGNPPVYEGPAPEQVPGLMSELARWLNEEELDAPPLVRASMAHLHLVSIHPWKDGNGRMGRCLHTLVLARDAVLAPEFSSIEEWLGLSTYNTAQYYAALAATQGGAYLPGRDAAPWLRFSLRAHHLQAQRVRRRFELAAELWSRLEEVVRSSGVHERTTSALYAAAQGHLRRTTYQVDEQLTRDQAIRDIQALRRHGLVRPVGQGRSARYVASGAAAGAADDLRDADTAPLADPYADPR